MIYFITKIFTIVFIILYIRIIILNKMNSQILRNNLNLKGVIFNTLVIFPTCHRLVQIKRNRGNISPSIFFYLFNSYFLYPHLFYICLFYVCRVKMAFILKWVQKFYAYFIFLKLMLSLTF
jgi:hypothetical protein